MIRMIAIGTVLAAGLAASSAFAQGSYEHHSFCLKSASGEQCAFNSMAQCNTARQGTSGTCVQNDAPMNHPR